MSYKEEVMAIYKDACERYPMEHQPTCLTIACAEVDRLRAENAKLREFLIELHSYLMQQIGAKTLNDSAKDGTQAISRKLSEILDALRPAAQEPKP